MNILFWVLFVVTIWFGLRHFITIFIGISQSGASVAGKRFLHLISVCILWGSSVIAFSKSIWWIMLIGIIAESLLRNSSHAVGDSD